MTQKATKCCHRHWHINPHHDLEHLNKNRKGTCSLTVQVYVTAGTVIIQHMWPGTMHGSFIWKDCDLLGSFEGIKLPKSWLQSDVQCVSKPWSSCLRLWLAYFSSSAMQPAHMQAKSWSAPLVFCAERSISIWQCTGINNNGEC
ncbi:uncharacterized protein LOC119178151 [Rhipicephalus microplus]|uniref:uncharacterized protein LOC119178151 n=1 Tax=Rhipicephalus microplus TaxID=6941 RepID=UPI003F6CCA37